jgi:PAS domain S-box-containing protein
LGILHFDNQSQILNCSEKAAALLGRDADELTGRRLTDLFRESYGSFTHEQLAPLWQGESLRYSLLWQQQGSFFSTEAALLPHQDENGRNKSGLLVFCSVREEASDEPTSVRDLSLALVQNSPVYYSVMDEDGKLFFLNEQYSRGQTNAHQQAGQAASIFDIVPKQRAHSYLDNARKAIHEGRTVITEEAGLRADGSPGMYLVHKFPLYGADQTLAGVIAIDISERKERERKIEELNLQLDENRRYYELLASNITDLLSLHETNGNTVFITPSVKKILGYDIDEIFGLPVLWGLHPDDTDSFRRQFEEALSGINVKARHRRRTKEGKYVWLEVNARDIHIDGKQYILAVSRDISEKKQSEDRLIERESYLHSLLRSQTNYLIRINRDYQYTFVNDRYREKFVKAPQESAHSILPDLHPDDQDSFKQAVSDCIENPVDVCPLTVRKAISDGEYLWIEWEFIAIQDQTGQVKELQGVGRDISEKIKQEQALLRKQKELSSIIDSQTNYLIRTDVEGCFTFTNPTFSHKFDYFGDLIGQSSMITIIPEDHDKVYRMAEECLENPGKMVPIEIRKPTRDGGTVVNYWEFVAITDEAGNPTEIQGVGYDITERKRAREVIEKSEAFLKALIENTNDAIWAVDEALRLAYANSNLLRLIRKVYGVELQAGRTGPDELPEDLREQWLSYHNRSQEEGRFQTEMHHEIDDELYYFEVSVNPIIDENDRFIGYSVFAHDITERKRIEHQLLSAKRSVEEALRARDTFLSMITHELRTPLNAILGMSQLLQTTRLGMSQRKYTESLSYSTRMLNSLINDILDYTSLQSGKFTMDQIDFNLTKILQQTVNLYQGKAIKRDLRLEYSQDDALPTYVKGDPIRLGQVLNNLLDNAFKFTEKGQVSIQAEVAGESAESSPVRIIISDSGMGIPEDMQDRIFEPFRQGSPEINQLYGGRGLGLAIVRNLVEHIGGKVHISSREGKGTRFELYLPFRKSSSEAQKAYDQVDISDHSASLEGIHVLYVEDISVNQILMKGICEQWAIRLDLASDGYEGLRMIEKNRYDLVLMDILMPGMNGYETSRKIRAMEGDYYQEVPIIALTAYKGHEMEEMLAESGMNDYVNKPLDFQELYRTLQRHLKISHEKSSPSEEMGKVEFDRLEQMAFKDRQRYYHFLDNLQQEFVKSRADLRQAVKQADNERISAIRHHTIALLSMFSSGQEVLIKQLKSLHVEKGKSKEAREKIRKIDTAFERILDKIGENIRELDRKKDE